MPQIIEVPGMGPVEFPDGMGDREIEQAIQASMPKAEGMLEEAGRVADKSIRGGLLAIPELASMLVTGAEGTGKGLAKLFGAEGGKDTEALMRMANPISVLKGLPERIKAVTGGEIAQPETVTGKYLGALGQGVVSSLLPGGGANRVKAAITGGGAGLGSEAAMHYLDDDTNPLVKILGALTGGAIGGVGSSMALLNAKDLAKELMRDVRPQDLKKAIADSLMARKLGVNTFPQQHMPRGSNLDTYVNTLAGNRAGQTVANELRNQPSQTGLLQENLLGEVPGQIRPTAIVGNNVQEVATEVLDATKRTRTQGWKDTFAAVADDLGVTGELGAKTVQKVQDFFTREAKKLGETSEAAQWLTALGGKLSTVKNVKEFQQTLIDTGLLDASGKAILKPSLETVTTAKNVPLQEVEQLNTLFKEATDGLKKVNLATSGVKTGNAKLLGGKVSQARELIGDENLPFKEADAWYKDFTTNVYNVVKKFTPMGRLAGVSGAVADREASAASKVFQIFDNGTVPGASTSEIKQVARKFREVEATPSGLAGKEVFNDAVKTWFSHGIDKANKVNPEKSADAIVKYFGDLTQYNSKVQGLRDMLSEVGKNTGLKPAEVTDYVKGFENMLKVFKAASKRPGNVSGVSSEEIVDAASVGVGRRLGQVSIMTPLRQPMLAWSAMVGHNSLKAIDNLITSPEGMRKLIEMGKQTPMSQLSVNTLATLLETAASVGATPKKSGGVDIVSVDGKSTGITPE